MRYTSIHNPKIKEIKKLRNKKYRDQLGLFVVEGEHLIIEALKAGVLKEVFIKEGVVFKKNFINVYEVTEEVLAYISELVTPPPMIGVCEKVVAKDLKDKILILEDIQDPGNIGTIIRSAVAFSIDTIILTKGCADLYSTKVIRSCQGLLFYINIIESEIEDVLNTLKQRKIPILGTKVNGGKDIKKIEKFSKFAIIMGNEGSGLSAQTLNLCDDYLYITMNPLCESLNVGVAASIILYEMNRV